MRQILVERRGADNSVKHGGDRQRVDCDDQLPAPDRSAEFLALDAALTDLEQYHGEAAKLVELRYFSGLTHQEAAHSMGLSRRQADRLWALARAWLYRHMSTG